MSGGSLAALVVMLLGFQGCNGIGDSYDARMNQPHQDVTQGASEEEGGEEETETAAEGEAPAEGGEGETPAAPEETKEASK